MPRILSNEKRRDIKDAIEAGIPVTEIRTLLSTSAETISNIKRVMGVPLRRMKTPRRRKTAAQEVAQAMQATVMHHRDIPRSLGMATAPTTVAHPYSPQEYFVAIAEGLRSRDAENAALRDEVTGLRSMAARLESDNLRLMSDLNQCKLQMANWSGPVSLPSMSLGNGG